jgi:hypothetical protein
VRRSGSRYLLTQGLDDAPVCNVPRAPEHDMECLMTLVVTRIRVREAIDSVHIPLGILLILVLLGIHLLFSLPLVGRCALLARLLLLFAKLFRELLDLSALTCNVAHGVVYRASCATVITNRGTNHLVGLGLHQSLQWGRRPMAGCYCQPSSYCCCYRHLEQWPHVGLAILACL